MILEFIKRFQRPDTITTFTEGCCYWFAYILASRFNGIIMYNEIDNHFGCLILEDVYDITGKINGKGFVVWEHYRDFEPLNSIRIENQCINIV